MYGLKKFYGETTIEKESVEDIGNPRTIRLKYYTTKNKHFKQNEKQYGVGIIKTEIGINEVNEEKQEFNHICEQKEEVENLLNILLKNKVTPIDLKYVLEDLIME
ncbi:MAG: hypothetical protein IJ777_00445 [Clostridia bacterium]|nr:hypothetical protein [Clostridia bacterium]